MRRSRCSQCALALSATAMAATLATACGDAAGTATAAEPVVRDSAGVTIVENVEPAWTAGGAWTLSPEPVLEIGMMDGPESYQLHRVTDAKRLPDGRIALANSGTQEIRLYDADGRFIRSLGGEGGGPGEFGFLNSIHLDGDGTILAHDLRNARVSTFHPDDGFVEAHTIPGGGIGPGAGVLGRAPDGSILFGVRTTSFDPRASSSADIARNPMAYLSWAIGAEEADTVRHYRGAEQIVRTQDAGGGRMMVTMMRAPFMRGTYGVLAAGRLYHGEAERPDIEVIDLAAGTETRVRWPAEMRPVSEDYIEAAREERSRQEREGVRMGGSAGGPGARPAAPDPFEGTPRPAHLPVYDALRAGADGSLWVRRFGWPGDETATWEVFDADGRWLGQMELPARFAIYDIGEDHVLGLWRDEFDVEYVRMYALDRGGA